MQNESDMDEDESTLDGLPQFHEEEELEVQESELILNAHEEILEAHERAEEYNREERTESEYGQLHEVTNVIIMQKKIL